eukprot:1396859-Prymnesium_polylepis.1
MRLCATLLLAAPRLLAASCAPYCMGSCCFFSEPAKECSTCDASYTCNAAAECYDDAAKRSAVMTQRDAEEPERPC